MSGFSTVAERPADNVALLGQTNSVNAKAQAETNAAVQLLMLSLKTLSQRTIVAVSSLFTAAGLASAWWLWSKVLPNPSILQLVGLGMYAAFLLLLEFVRRR